MLDVHKTALFSFLYRHFLHFYEEVSGAFLTFLFLKENSVSLSLIRQPDTKRTLLVVAENVVRLTSAFRIDMVMYLYRFIVLFL